jgi:cullin 1
MPAGRGNGSSGLEEVWNGNNGLSKAIDDIFSIDFDLKRYMLTYTNVYDYCTAANKSDQPRSGPPGQRGSRGANRQNRGQQTSAGFIGAELYEKLKLEIKSRVEIVSKEGRAKFGLDLLKYYSKSWSDYRFAIKVLDGVCRYLNRHWVSRERDERGDDADSKVYIILDLGIVQWREIFYGLQTKQLITEILNVIEKERNDEVHQDNTDLLRIIVKESFVELGLKKKILDKNQEVPDLAVYEAGFESEFLKQTRDFYRKESSEFIAANTVVEYLKKVERRFTEEQKRVKNYMDEATGDKVESVLVDVLIKDHIDRLYEEFKLLLTQDKLEDLSRLYSLVKKTENHRNRAEENSVLDPMRDSFKEHITTQGKNAISSVKATALTDPKSYVDTILDIHKKYHSLVTDAFDNDSGFATSLDRAASDFVNSNAVCADKKNRSAELLAKYSDSILKKSNKTSAEIDIEKTLSEIIIVFKFITDKDIFLEFYSKLFGNRLVKETSASEDHEQSMILKLKAESGYEFTSKLLKMFQDISLSKALNEEFRKFVKNLDAASSEGNSTKALDFNIKVLTTGSWPYKTTNELALPRELELCRERFLNFYSSKHNGRKISWIWTQCRGDIKYIPTGSSNSYTFTTTTHQIAILVLFNEKEEIQVDEIARKTQIEFENDYIYKVISTLLKVKLLICKDRKIEEDQLVTDQDTLICNNRYKSKKKKMNISMPIKSEIRQESDATIQKVEEDRGLSIQAAIVRIMKARKKSDHQNLLAEVISQLQSRFIPKGMTHIRRLINDSLFQVQLIKKQIEVLVEKEYLARAEGERNTYEYLA